MICEGHLTGGPWDGSLLLVESDQLRIVIPAAQDERDPAWSENATYLPRRKDGQVVTAPPMRREFTLAQVYDYAGPGEVHYAQEGARDE